MYKQNWNLDVIFNGGIESKELKNKFQEIENKLSDLKKIGLYDLESVFIFTEKIQEIKASMLQINSFLESWSAVNYGDSRSAIKFNQLANLNLKETELEVDFSRFLSSLNDDEFEKIINSKQGSEIKLVLIELRKKAQRLLDDTSENLINKLAIDGLSAWSSHYDTIVANLNTTYKTSSGEIKNVSAGQALNMYGTLPDPVERKNLMNNYEKMWADAENISANTLNHLAGSRLTEQNAHGYKNHLEYPLEMNRMSKETLDTMWDTISKNKQFLVDFLNRKQKILKLGELQWQDQSAPLKIEGLEESANSYDDAVKFIIDNFAKYSPKMASMAKTAFEDGWIESEDRAGKQPGGFDISLPESKVDRIFLTYTGSVSDAATIAHELGHAFHSHVLYDLPQWRQEYAMNVAETASTFAETIVNNANVDSAETDAEKIILLDAKLENAVAMLMNIHARFLFEDNFYKKRKNGLLTAQELNQLMSDAQIKAFAGVLDSDGTHPHFWSSKLHFYIDEVPFYNFPYVFGYLFSQGIFAWAQQTDNFEESYINLLRDTANMSVEELAMKHLKVDLTKPDFWQSSIDSIKKDVDQFMQLTENI